MATGNCDVQTDASSDLAAELLDDLAVPDLPQSSGRTRRGTFMGRDRRHGWNLG